MKIKRSRRVSVPSDALLGLLGAMLDNAQTVRIIQVQSRISQRYKEKADAAWQHLNAAHKAATELVQPNARPHAEAVADSVQADVGGK